MADEDFNNLPEGCIATILSLTSPKDACRLSLVSSTFQSAAESDAVWHKFLPSDFHTLLSQSPSSSFPSKKHLYIHLCHNPLLIDHGKKSFQLDKVYGKKCYMLSARTLFIVWGDTPRYWGWTSLPDARFSEVAELVSVCWLEIRGWINTGMLSPKTLYGAYLVFKPSPAGIFGFDYQSVEVSVGIAGGEASKRTVFLDAERGRRLRYQIVPRRAGIFNRARFLTSVETPPAQHNSNINNNNNSSNNNNSVDLQYPKERGDGWMEVELGDFFNDGEDDKEVEMGVCEIKSGDWKGGLFLQGIEIRPKTVPSIS
ncbi:putative F-box protein PP2-B12 [Vigna unguiculata]|uniref:putative F-box protein PP2-B12 n=1 Tax=Vigna unguiculata TaxID=3917 RepID=UPI001016C5F1|nr:putative F-box protein PP2-B12 [Vigna unguiculata]